MVSLQFKNWVVDAYEQAYGQPVSGYDLTQGCNWRKEFLYTYFNFLPQTDPTYDFAQQYIKYYDSGNMRSC